MAQVDKMDAMDAKRKAATRCCDCYEELTPENTHYRGGICDRCEAAESREFWALSAVLPRGLSGADVERIREGQARTGVGTAGGGKAPLGQWYFYTKIVIASPSH